MPTIPIAQDPYDLNMIEDSFPVIEQNIAQYGDIVRVKGLKRSEDSVIINHPDMIKRVLINNNKNYIKGVGFERVSMLLGNGLITSDGDFWRNQRRMIQPSFHKSVLEMMAEAMREANIEMQTEWQSKADNDGLIDITEASSKITLEVVLVSIFGDDYPAMKNREGGNPFAILMDHGPRDLQFAYKFKQLHKIIAELIAERRKRTEEPSVDFLSLFLQAKNADGEAMSDKALLDEIVTMIVAGHETAAMTLNWSWYLLSQNPDAETKLHAEVDKLDKDFPTYADFPELPYTRQIMEETLRLYPPVWVLTRKALADDVLAGYEIKKGEQVFVSPYFMHRHEQYWDKPEAFQPERFDESKLSDIEKNRNRYAYLPFSLGPRRCIGDIFAQTEMYIHLASMSRKFILRKADDNPIELAPNINLLTRHPIMMRISNR